MSEIAVVIPAGGGGTRLWPRSRRAIPKQFLDIVQPDRTMIQVTVDRVAPDFVPLSHVYVVTSERHVGLVREQLDIPRQNVVGEPLARDSAAAVGLMAALIERRIGPDALMVVLPADHEIRDPNTFRESLRVAAATAQQDYLVTLGIHATSADTGFGYIQRGESLHADSSPALHVKRFREKPDRVTAQQYVASGEYYWNAGMYVARVGIFRALFQRLMPEMEPLLVEMAAVFGTPEQEVTFARLYPQLAKISFDFAIVEKAERVAVIPADIGWSDVGSWSRLAELLETLADQEGNVTFRHPHHVIDTKDTLIYAPDKFVAVIGVEGLVIVDTPDALLVVPKERCEDVKHIVEKLQTEGRHDLL